MAELANRDEVQKILVSRVIENAPIKELLRVYSEAVSAAIEKLSDEELVGSIAAAGYQDILDHFGLTAPAE